MRGPAIRFEHVSLALGGTQILHDVNFSVAPGEIHCVIGPNGGGKTSLIRSLLGQMPHKGNIAVSWGETRTIGYVPQALDFDKTLPVTVDRADPKRIKIEWDEVSSSRDRAQQMAHHWLENRRENSAAGPDCSGAGRSAPEGQLRRSARTVGATVRA